MLRFDLNQLPIMGTIISVAELAARTGYSTRVHSTMEDPRHATAPPLMPSPSASDCIPESCGQTGSAPLNPHGCQRPGSAA